VRGSKNRKCSLWHASLFCTLHVHCRIVNRAVIVWVKLCTIKRCNVHIMPTHNDCKNNSCWCIWKSAGWKRIQKTWFHNRIFCTLVLSKSTKQKVRKLITNQHKRYKRSEEMCHKSCWQADVKWSLICRRCWLNTVVGGSSCCLSLILAAYLISQSHSTNRADCIPLKYQKQPSQTTEYHSVWFFSHHFANFNKLRHIL